MISFHSTDPWQADKDAAREALVAMKTSDAAAARCMRPAREARNARGLAASINDARGDMPLPTGHALAYVLLP